MVLYEDQGALDRRWTYSYEWKTMVGVYKNPIMFQGAVCPWLELMSV